MQLNRNTLILLFASLVVIVAVLALNGANSGEEATATPVVDDTTVALFGEAMSGDSLIRLTLTDHASEAETVIAQDEGGAWIIEAATNATERAVDQDLVSNVAASLVGLTATDSFTGVALADFGLEEPAYTIVAVLAGEDETTTYTIFIGNENPTGNRYYAAREGDEEPTVYTLPMTTADSVLALVSAPPYVPPPTDTPTPLPTANPYSEVEQTATAEIVQQTATAEAEATATAVFEATTAAEEAEDDANTDDAEADDGSSAADEESDATEADDTAAEEAESTPTPDPLDAPAGGE